MDKPVAAQQNPNEYPMQGMGASPAQQPMVSQGTGYEQPPMYHQQPMVSSPPNAQPTFPMPGQQDASQKPGVGQGYNHPDGTYGMPLTALGSTSAPVTCPNCGYRGMTNVEFESGGFTHLVALGLCCLACLGCFAYLASSLKDCHHRCAKCNVPLATYHRSGRTELHFRPE